MMVVSTLPAFQMTEKGGSQYAYQDMRKVLSAPKFSSCFSGVVACSSCGVVVAEAKMSSRLEPNFVSVAPHQFCDCSFWNLVQLEQEHQHFLSLRHETRVCPKKNAAWPYPPTSAVTGEVFASFLLTWSTQSYLSWIELECTSEIRPIESHNGSSRA